MASEVQSLWHWARRLAARPWWLVLPMLALPWLWSDYFSVPVVFQPCSVRQPTLVKGAEPFSVTGFASKRGGRTVPVGGSFRTETRDVPFNLSGTAVPTDGTALRVFLVSYSGRIFLHEPPLQIQNGQWSVQDLRPGSDIRAIRFVRVSESSSRAFTAQVARLSWGPVQLPPDAREVASIALTPAPLHRGDDGRGCKR